MEWIKCSGRLPELNIPVLAFANGLIFVAERWSNGEREFFKSVICTCWYEEYNQKITHWMPLPECPKD